MQLFLGNGNIITKLIAYEDCPKRWFNLGTLLRYKILDFRKLANKKYSNYFDK
jgi:hypothetical protein